MKKDASKEEKKEREAQRAAHAAAGWTKVYRATRNGGLRGRMVRRGK